MLRLILILIGSLLIFNLSFAQAPSVTLEDKHYTLNERYSLMKSKAQTYQDYKVIKEVFLDGVWKIVMDSARGQKLLISQSRQTISQLEGNLQMANTTLRVERESAAAIVFASEHITVIGIDFKKSTFLTMIAILLGILALLITFISAKMKLIRATMKEKIVIADVVMHEYEEYKRKALEKQTKLSRELQSERNKLEELRIR